MKRKNVFLSSTIALILLLGYSCSNDDFLSDYEIQQMIDNSLNGQWKIVNVEINGSDWERFDSAEEGYYYALVNLPELTENIFDEGAALAYYKFDINSKTALPYVKTTVGTDGFAFTETYSCDFVLGNPSQATFYLEASDVGAYDSNPPSGLFQIVLIW